MQQFKGIDVIRQCSSADWFDFDYVAKCKEGHSLIGIAMANSVLSDLGPTSRVYFDNVGDVYTIISVVAAKQTVKTFHNKHCFE